MLHQIGAGALGPVFRAYQPEPGRLVAVKLFRLDLPPERVHQLTAALEGLVAIELAHPGLAAPIGAGSSGVSAYLAQDFVAADSLDVVVRSAGSSSPALVARVAAQLGSALDYAADHDVLHGALHPRDVMLSDDDARMTGLGVARALEQVGIVTPVRRPYSAPERAVGGPWDGRADMYSLAALMFELLVGRRISGAGERAVTALPDIAGTNRVALKRVFARALSADPRGRFPSGAAFADALQSALVATAPSAVPLLFEPSDTVVETSAGPAPSPDHPHDHQNERTQARPRARRPRQNSADQETKSIDQAEAVEDDADRGTATALEARVPESGRQQAEGQTAGLVERAEHTANDLVEGDREADKPADEQADVVDDLHEAVSPAVSSERLGDLSSDVRGEPAEAPLLPLEDSGSGITGLFAGVIDGTHDRTSDRADDGARDAADELAPYSAVDSHAHDLDLHSADRHDDGRHRQESISQASSRPHEPALELSASLSSTPLSSTPPPFSAMALESSRSAVWPLVLSLGVGIAIGFGLAMVFFVGGGQTQQPQSVTAGRADGRADARSEERPAPTVLVEPPIVPEEALTKSPVVAPPVTPRAGVPLPSATAVAPGPVAPLTSSSSTSSSAPSPMSSQTSSQTSSTASPIPTASAPVRTRTPPVPALGRLLIRSTPSGAQVSLDGKSAGTTPLTLREVARGAHTVRVAREGFVSVERRVALTEASAVVTVSVDLVARPVPKPAAVPVAPARRPPPPSAGGAAETGALSVDSRPVGASVFIDGKLVGTTPLLIPTINAAGHTIAMELSGYKRWTSSVTITPGERTRVAASLEQ